MYRKLSSLRLTLSAERREHRRKLESLRYILGHLAAYIGHRFFWSPQPLFYSGAEFP